VTGGKSRAQISSAWLCRNVDQRRPARRGGRASRMYFWTVHLATRMASFAISPRRRSAPRRTLAAAISRIGAIVPSDTFARRAVGVPRAFRRQGPRDRCRCQRRRVSGWTISRACRQQRTRLARSASTARSAGVRRGRLIPRLSTTSRWRENACSATGPGMLRVRSVNVPRVIPEAAGLVAAERWSRTARGTARPVPATRPRERASIGSSFACGPVSATSFIAPMLVLSG
jgi:hypothetical protein